MRGPNRIVDVMSTIMGRLCILSSCKGRPFCARPAIKGVAAALAALCCFKLESEGEKCQRLWLLLKSFPLLDFLVVVVPQLSQKPFEKLATNQDLSNAIEKVSTTTRSSWSSWLLRVNSSFFGKRKELHHAAASSGFTSLRLESFKRKQRGNLSRSRFLIETVRWCCSKLFPSFIS